MYLHRTIAPHFSPQDAGGNLFPVPVKLLNLRVGGTQVNYANGVETTLPGAIKLVQRFFLVDAGTCVRSDLIATKPNSK